MEERCFCHLEDGRGNIYVVKDKEARQKIQDLQPTDEIIESSEKPITSGAVYDSLHNLALLLENI